MKLFLARLRNRWIRHRLRNRRLEPEARINLKALDQIDTSRPAKAYRYVVIDLETTGVNRRHDRMVSIAGVRIGDGKIQLNEIFSEMIKPDREIPSASIKLHGIFPSRVTEARTADEVFTDFLKFIGDDILVAQCTGFDLHFLNRRMKCKYGFRLQNLALDTEKLYRELFALALRIPSRSDRLQSRCSLEAIADHFGIVIQDRHTAVGDAMATAMIFQRILARLNHGMDPLNRLVKRGWLYP